MDGVPGGALCDKVPPGMPLLVFDAAMCTTFDAVVMCLRQRQDRTERQVLMAKDSDSVSHLRLQEWHNLWHIIKLVRTSVCTIPSRRLTILQPSILLPWSRYAFHCPHT